jgi:hypothetical protein
MRAILPGAVDAICGYPIELGCHDIEVSDGRERSTTDGEARVAGGRSIDELLDRAVAAINRGDRAMATALVGQVLGRR